MNVFQEIRKIENIENDIILYSNFCLVRKQDFFPKFSKNYEKLLFIIINQSKNGPFNPIIEQFFA